MNKKTEAFKKENLTILAILLISFFITLGVYLSISLLNIDKPDVINSKLIVTKIIDGDTFELNNGDIIRLICIDAPELGKPGYNEAKDYLSKLILNKEVRLVSDIDDKDNYKRLLRYVYVNTSIEKTCNNKVNSNDPNILSDSTCINIGSPNEVFVNKELVKNNFATIFRYENNTALCNEIADD